MTFTRRHRGRPARTEEEVSDAAWSGAVVLAHQWLAQDMFARMFPSVCQDNPAQIVGTDESLLALAVADRVAPLSWPLDRRESPGSDVVMDFLEFAFRHAAEPRALSHHGFFGHPHLAFDVRKGRLTVKREVNDLFDRHGIAFEMNGRGAIERIGSAVLRDHLNTSEFETGDDLLNELLATAVSEFRSRRPGSRERAVKELWDAWERLKSAASPKNKSESVRVIIERATASPAVQGVLADDAQALTRIGNAFRIRHSEVGTHELPDDVDAEYLFHRLLNLIIRLARSRS